MKKTTKACIQAVESFDIYRKQWEGILKIKKETSPELLYDWVNDTSEDTIIGRIEGYRTAVESLLMYSRCYHGFRYVDHHGNPLEFIEGQSVQDNPEYRQYRVSFIIKH